MARSRVIAASGLAFAVVTAGAGVTWAATNSGHDAATGPVTSPSGTYWRGAIAPRVELFGPDNLPAGPVKVVRGQTLVVHLSEQAGSTGYSWSATVRGGSLVKDGDAVSAPPTSSKPMVGTPGDHAFTFRTQGSGAAQLVFILKRPFEDQPAKTVSLSVTVGAPDPA